MTRTLLDTARRELHILTELILGGPPTAGVAPNEPSATLANDVTRMRGANASSGAALLA